MEPSAHHASPAQPSLHGSALRQLRARSRSFLGLTEEQKLARVQRIMSPERALGKAPSSTLVLSWSLVLVGAPVVLGQLVLALASVPNINLEREVDYIEYFAGRHALTSAFQQAGKLAISYEKADNNYYQDFLGDVGFCHAMHLALKLKPGGGAHAGIVCSTWIGMNVGTSGRRWAGSDFHQSQRATAW